MSSHTISMLVGEEEGGGIETLIFGEILTQNLVCQLQGERGGGSIIIGFEGGTHLLIPPSPSPQR